MPYRQTLKIPAVALLASCMVPVGTGLAQEASNIPPLEWQTGDTAIEVYGLVNFGALSFDDGEDRTNYGLVGNSNASNRLGIRSDTVLDSGWNVFGNFEFQYVPHASAAVNQLDPDAADYDLDKTDIRKMEVAFISEGFGTFWLGQGSMASDLSSEVDLSGTGAIAYSSVADIGGGLFRTGDGTLSGISTSGAYSNLDGLGRKTRIRYDSPSLGGFRLKTSWGQDVLNDSSDDLYDIAATYEGEFETFVMAGALAWAHDDGNDADIVSGSVSALHPGSGLSLTLAGAGRNADVDSGMGYVKLGWERDFFATGATAFSIDYYNGRDVVNDGSDSASWGLAMVQDVDSWNSEWYLGVRRYDYDDDAADYQDGLATMIGLLVRF